VAQLVADDWPALLVASVLAMRALIAIPMKAIFEAVQDEK
jgi:hypothetical protein